MKLPLLGLSLVLLVASCTKDDFEQTSADIAPSDNAVLNNTDTVGWKSSSHWETADQETFSVRYFSIEDANITADVADNGLVLLYKRDGNTINSLPFEEPASTVANETETTDQNSNANYWYHQVAEGSLLISCDIYGSKTAPDAANAFKYFVIAPEKLQSLQADGHTTEELMNLSYAEATTLLNSVN